MNNLAATYSNQGRWEEELEGPTRAGCMAFGSSIHPLYYV